MRVLAVGDEDRVVAESLGPARLRGDPALEQPGAAGLLAVRRDRDQLADVAGAPVGGGSERGEQSADRVAAQRAERIPGAPSSAATSIPESSPSIQPPDGPTSRPCTAFARAFS